VKLASELSKRSTGHTIYILDEPTIGLHARDNGLLLATLERLRAKGNTVVVVEHDEATIRRAEHLIDLGPGAGVDGGEEPVGVRFLRRRYRPRSRLRGRVYLRGTGRSPDRRVDPRPGGGDRGGGCGGAGESRQQRVGRGLVRAGATGDGGGRDGDLVGGAAVGRGMQELVGELRNRYLVTYARPDSLIPPEEVRVSVDRPGVTARGMLLRSQETRNR